MTARARRSSRTKRSANRSRNRSPKRSPKRTPRPIGLPPYLQRNLKSLKFGEGRGSKTRGWLILSPKRGRARHALMAKCGPKAFLLPSQEKFPVMTLAEKGCRYNSAGLHSALVRARQYGYGSVAAKAKRLIKQLGV